MNCIENHYGQPYHHADAYRSRGNVFDGPDFFIMSGFYEITYGFNGSVEQLCNQNQSGGKQDHFEIQPLPVNERRQKNDQGEHHLVGESEFIANGEPETGQDDFELMQGAITVFTGAEKFIAYMTSEFFSLLPSQGIPGRKRPRRSADPLRSGR